jgi:ferredoxin-NADP reductase
MALKRIKPGDWALIDAPYGRFTFEGEYPKICLLTGGIGITPFRSIIKYCTDSGISSDIVLFYGCHSPKEMAFKNEFEEMMIKNKNLRVVFTVSEPNIDWKGYVGNITLDMLKKEAPDYEDRIFYACGPPGMITAMKKLIQRLGIAETRLNLESFLGYG